MFSEKTKGDDFMNDSLTLMSYMLAAMAGICFVKGLVVLSYGRRK